MKYYFFNINPIYKKLCSKYELFSFLKRIYLNNNDSIKTEIQYSHLTNKIDYKEMNDSINKVFEKNRFYNHSKYIYFYNNKYRKEKFTLKIGNNVLFYNGNHQNKLLLNALQKYTLFACDFQEQDYFWINEISC